MTIFYVCKKNCLSGYIQQKEKMEDTAVYRRLVFDTCFGDLYKQSGT